MDRSKVEAPEGAPIMGTNDGLPTVSPHAAAQPRLMPGATASVGKEADTGAVVEEEVAVLVASLATSLSLFIEMAPLMEALPEARENTVKWKRNMNSRNQT